MAYFLASIISIVAAFMILFTRYEADDSQIKADLEHMKVMFSMVDGFVNTYINSGENMQDINFEILEDRGILLSNATVVGAGNSAVMTLPNSNVTWQLIPNKNDATSYKILVDITRSSSLMSKSVFSESFIGREYCQKALFGSFETNTNSYNGTDDFVNSGGGTNSDGLFVCVVFK
ncbi:hypothetical protein [Arcobacter sp. FWKO B]|uniref:hypothetical protein n=1 Tax=Arcobacter sp. FWKO B TaxID=2593672 RepID=UPI0018A3DA3B|nr:hypothetical protein [Arcobacter sp. FWKO B]QOG11221.1 hypothetical protein FWKOB_00305 [Arcobacter sp. FWKO B]